MKIKRLPAMMFSFLLCVFILCGVAYAGKPLQSFIEMVAAHKHQFVCDKNRDRLTYELDCSIAPGVASKLDRETLYHIIVKRILENSGQVKYNCRVLAAWALFELRSRGIKCKDLTIALYSLKERKINYHAAVLIPCKRDGVKEWYVCDISAMSELQEDAFVFMELNCYVSMYGKYLRGIAVNDDEYARDSTDLDTPYIDTFIVGRDLTAWLATDGDDVNSAVELLRSQQTHKLRVMSSAGTMGMDSDTAMGVAISRAPDLALKGFEFIEI